MGRNRKAALGLAIAFLAIAVPASAGPIVLEPKTPLSTLLAPELPRSSTESVPTLPGTAKLAADPFNFYFDADGDATFQRTNNDGSLSGGLTAAPPAFLSNGYLTYTLPEYVNPGYLGVLAPGTTVSGSANLSLAPSIFGLYPISNPTPQGLAYGLYFFTDPNDSNKSDMQLYQQSGGALLAPPAFFSGVDYAIVNPDPTSADFSYEPYDVAFQQANDNRVSQTVDNEFFFQPVLPAALEVPEPSLPIAILGVASMGVVGWIRQFYRCSRASSAQGPRHLRIADGLKNSVGHRQNA
jgi:hypothetical protein